MNQTKYIYVGWLIDGTGGPVQEKVLVEIIDGKINDIVSYNKDLGLENGDFTDLSHCTILPPLFDSHVHLFMSGTTDQILREHQLTAGYEELQKVLAQHLHYLFTHGVLGVRDGGDRGGFAGKFRESEEMHPGVSLKVAGRAYHSKNRYGSLIGRVPEYGTLEEAYNQDTEEKDFVKVVNSGLNSLSQYGLETAPQFSQQSLSKVVKMAEEKGQKVMVHANGEEPVKLAVEAGCHSIEHGFFMGKENLKRIADRGLSWIPTVFTMKAYGDNLSSCEINADPDVLSRNVDHQLEQLQLARELGVNVVLGTDAGSTGVLHGESVVEEMKLFKKAGFSLPEIISCATAKGAELLGIEDFGEIKKGMSASFLVSRGSPAQMPRKLSYLEEIYINGTPSSLYRKNPFKHV